MNTLLISCVPNIKQFLNDNCKRLQHIKKKDVKTSWCESPLLGTFYYYTFYFYKNKTKKNN